MLKFGVCCHLTWSLIQTFFSIIAWRLSSRVWLAIWYLTDFPIHGFGIKPMYIMRYPPKKYKPNIHTDLCGIFTIPLTLFEVEMSTIVKRMAPAINCVVPIICWWVITAEPRELHGVSGRGHLFIISLFVVKHSAEWRLCFISKPPVSCRRPSQSELLVYL